MSIITLKEIAFYGDEFLSKTIGSKTKKKFAENMGIITVEKLLFLMMLPALDQRNSRDRISGHLF